MSTTITIYHNPRWGKSRSSVGILDSKKVNYEEIRYIDNPLSISELKKLSKKLNLKPKDFIRKREQNFIDLKLGDQLDNDEVLFEAMSRFPKLIERPIVVNGEKATIGRPPEKILEII